MGVELETWPPNTENFAAIFEEVVDVLVVSRRRKICYVQGKTCAGSDLDLFVHEIFAIS